MMLSDEMMVAWRTTIEKVSMSGGDLGGRAAGRERRDPSVTSLGDASCNPGA